MDVRSPFFSNLALALAGMMFLNPIVATAAQVTVDGNRTQVGAAGNGVPVVNIATPNGNGLSHNTFKDYNVGKQGLILNNATERTQQTQLGGIIIGNPNLNGKAAGVILNEVTGSNRSQLKGYTEVAGQAARVIVANPHGITCDGCGFINTPQATLTTGKPVLDNGRLSHFDVNGGDIAIEGMGINATNLDQFDLITRSAKINAEIHARELNIITGRNQVDATTLKATAKAADGSDKPQLAIDSSALGGMYAGAIRLVGTEAGVGVKLAGDLAASGGDIQIDASGKLTLAQTAAQQNITITAQSIDLTDKVYAQGQANVKTAGTLNNQQSLAAANQVTVQAGTLNNAGIIEAGVNANNTRNAQADLKVTAQTVNNSGALIANRNLQVTASNTLNNQGSTLSGKSATSIDAGKLDNRGGQILANTQLDVKATTLDNREDGLINSLQNLKVQAGQISNQGGELSAKGGVTVTATTLNNQQGRVIAEKGLQVTTTGAVDNRGGTIAAKEALTLSSGSLDNSADGLVNAAQALNLKTGALNNQGGEVSAKGAVSVSATTLNNQQGSLIAEKGLQLTATGAVDNRGGTVAAKETVTLSSASLNNSADGLVNAAQTLNIKTGTLNNQAGELSAKGQLLLSGDYLDNRGGILVSGTNARLTLRDTLDNSASGTISAGSDLTVQATTVNNGNDGLLASQGNLNLTVEQLGNQMGLLLSKGVLTANLGSLDNRGGSVSAETGLTLSASTVDNRDQGLITSNSDLQLTADSLDASQGGEVSSGGDLQLNLQQLTQQQGRLISDGALRLNLNNGILNNRGGLISAQGPLSLEALAELDNRGGEISSPLAFSLQAARIDNSDGGLIISREQLSLNADTLLNRNKGLISGWQGVTISGKTLDNSALGTVSSSEGALDVSLSGALNNSSEGALVSQGDLTVKAASLTNSAGGILSTDSDLDLQLSSLNNQQGLISAAGNLIATVTTVNNNAGQLAAENVSLTAQTVNNSAGQITANDSLNLTVSETLTNKSGGQIAAGKQLDLSAGTIDNQGGTLASQGAMSLTADTLNNSNGGTIAVGDALKLSVGSLNNSRDGLIYSQKGALDLEADAFDNTAGVVQAQNGLDLNITNALNNQQGKLLAQQGELNISANSLSNQSGIINGFAGKLGLSVAGLLNNTGGTLQGQSLQVSSGDLNNSSGHLSALSGDAEVIAQAINNQDGGLYAKQLLKVTARSLDNLRGQVAGRTIDFSLAGALNNQSGIIESNAGMQLVAASINNQQGALRALSASQGDMVIRSSGLLNNNQGLIETATQNLQFDLGSFSNAGGKVIHVGTGTFGLGSAQAVQAGGDLLTNGDFTLTTGSWTHSGTLQARNLTLNVGTFNQTAEGKLLATRNLTATGANWNNQGLIASDGSLNLNLTGRYQGDGQLISLGDLTLKAGNLTLNENTRITGGALTDITVSNELLNRGVLTSLGDFTLRAATVNNYGTLGGAEDLKLYAPTLRNENGLIFSGADMALRVNNFTNLYADVYSMGALDLARDDQGNQAALVENRSSTIESLGDMSIYAATLNNLRDYLEYESGVYSARIDERFCVQPGVDCSGKRSSWFEITQLSRLLVTDASQRSEILSGGNLTVQGGSLSNQNSLISAAGNIDFTLNRFSNVGFEEGELKTTRMWRLVRMRSKYIVRHQNNAVEFTDKYWHESENYSPVGEDAIAAAINQIISDSDFEQELLDRKTSEYTGSDNQVYAGVIQAGGNATVRVRGTLENNVVSPYYTYVGGGQRDTDIAGGSSYASKLTINQQLPPDLQQKQVNPLTLPGFTLPSGEHGLFRLSNQDSSSTTTGGAGDVNLPGSSNLNSSVGSSALIGGIDQLQSQALALSAAHSSGSHKYLIETNPALTNLKQFMSSDYLLGQLNYNPDEAQKRLGDGLYEQRLIREAVMARTGQRYINGINSDEELFRYLMDNAIAYKDKLGLSLGVSLTAEQVAALTHDIVWMEEYEINGELVLVPIVYLAQAEGRLAGNGALIMGNDVTLISGGDLSNQGTLRASNNLSATAENIHNSGLLEASNRLELLANDSIINSAGGIIKGRDVNLTALTGDVINERTVVQHESSLDGRTWSAGLAGAASRIEAGNDLAIRAGRDVQSVGSVVQAGRDISVSAGRDVVVSSAETYDGYTRDNRYANQTKQLASEVTAGRDLTISAGENMAIVASDLSAGGDLTLAAGDDLLISSAADESHNYGKSKKVTYQNDSVTQRSSNLSAGGDLVLTAGDNLTMIASNAEAGGEAYLYAGENLSLLSAEDQSYSFYSKTKKKRSLGSSTVTSTMRLDSSTTQQGSSVTGDTVQLIAGKDMLVSGSDVVSTQETNLLAGGNVLITGATETEQHDAARSKKKSGLMSSGGIGFTIGSSSVKSTQDTTQEFNRESNVASILGDVNIQAGQTLTVKGSDILAGQDVNLTGQDVNILAAENTNRSESTHKSKKSGVTLALSGAVGSALNTTYQNAREARNEDDSRISALQGMKAGLSGYQAWQAAEAGGGITEANAGQFFGIAVSLGSQKSSSKQTMEQTISQGSNIQAGNNLNILATGKNGQGGDITVRGSQLQSGNDTLLIANQDINLEAAANRQKLDGSNKSGGGNIGLSFGGGSDGYGIGIFANANTSTGKEKGTGTTWTETTLDAGGTTTLVSGRDTTLQGAQVNADKIIASIGRDLTLQSLQDSDDYDYKQSSAGVGGSFYFGSMTGSGYISASKDKIKSEYDSVQEQTGLFAGKGGYQIDVGNHTQLDGAVIASAADADKNRLSTGTLGWSDIGNKAEYSSSTASINASTGGEKGGNKFFGNMAGGVGAAGNRGDSSSSTTYSAVSEGTIEIRNPDEQKQDIADLRRDTENTANGLSPIFDKEKEQKRLQEIRLIGEIGQQSMDIVRTHGEIEGTRRGKEELEAQGTYEPGPDASTTDREEYDKKLHATAGYREVMGDFGTGGTYQQITQAVTAALQGLSGGNMGAAASGAAAPYLATIIKEMTGDNDTARLMAHAVLGAVVADLQGNSAAAGAAGAFTGESVAMIALQVYGKTPGELNEQEKQIVSNLSMLAGGIAGGLAGDSSTSAAAGAGAGKNAADNNWLLPKGMDEYGAGAASLGEYMVENGASPGEVSEALSKYARGDVTYQDPAKAMLVANGVVIGVGLAGIVLVGATPAVVASAEAALSGCTLNPVLCLNQAGIVASEAVGGMGATVYGVGKSTTAARQAANKGAQVLDELAVVAKPGVSAPKGANRLPVPDDLPTNIHMGQQGKHIKGHNNFQEGRSYFNDGVDPAELLSGVHSGQYPVVGTGARGNPIVDFGKPIGVDGRTGQIVTKGQIHYGSNGAHIVPDARN